MLSVGVFVDSRLLFWLLRMFLLPRILDTRLACPSGVVALYRRVRPPKRAFSYTGWRPGAFRQFRSPRPGIESRACCGRSRKEVLLLCKCLIMSCFYSSHILPYPSTYCVSNSGPASRSRILGAVSPPRRLLWKLLIVSCLRKSDIKKRNTAFA